jgi:hypothetical protein
MRTLASVVAVAVLAVLVPPGCVDYEPSADPASSVEASVESANASVFVSFKTKCSLVFPTPKREDPIVYPGQVNVGHLHEFFGNTGITPNSTGYTLQANGAAMHDTCADRFDTAAYWVPALYRNGLRVVPVGVDVYYHKLENVQDSSGHPLTRVVEPPTDFRLIAGDKGAAAAPKDFATVQWTCLGTPNQQFHAPPSCYDPAHPGAVIGGQIHFPTCWDGGNDLQSNKTNNVLPVATNNNTKVCPAGHGVLVPELLLTVHYDQDSRPDCNLVGTSQYPGTPEPGVNCDVYSLSEDVGGQLTKNGSIFGYHADFLNGWSDGPDTTPNVNNPPGADDFASLIERCDNPTNPTTACGVQQTTGPAPNQVGGDAFVPFQ